MHGEGVLVAEAHIAVLHLAELGGLPFFPWVAHRLRRMDLYK